jgi:hypothetical protein
MTVLWIKLAVWIVVALVVGVTAVLFNKEQ